MGIGQSKGYRGNKQPQYQQPGLPAGYPYPPPFIPGYGQQYGAPMFPVPQQGFIPPGYGPPPAPMLNWMPQDRQRSRKKTRRTRQSENFPGGFNPNGPRDSDGPDRPRSASTSRRRASEPVIPNYRQQQREEGSPVRRMPTPFIPPLAVYDDDDDDREEEHPPRDERPASRQSGNRRPSVTYPQPPVQADLANVIEPLEPANPSAYGPPGWRSTAPLRNPLPPPPRDLYELSPYKSLLSLPQTTALLTATYGPQQFPSAQAALAGTAKRPERKKSIKGLLRSFSSRKEKNRASEQPQVRFIPVFVNQPGATQQGQSSSQQQLPDTQRRDASPSRPHSERSRLTSFRESPPNSGGLRTGDTGETFDTSRHSSASISSPVEAVPPVPPMPSSPPELRFDQDSPYYAFMNHSPHRVLYRNLIYPTALHLHEALKFLDARPDIAEAIRNTASIHDVYPIAARYQEFQRPDWNQRFLAVMEEVLYNKFKQHPDLRILLLGTGDARIVYADVGDTFWGTGGSSGGGQNELGKALGRVRERLRQEGAQ